MPGHRSRYTSRENVRSPVAHSASGPAKTLTSPAAGSTPVGWIGRAPTKSSAVTYRRLPSVWASVKPVSVNHTDARAPRSQ